jgi:hypothetical protein
LAQANQRGKENSFNPFIKRLSRTITWRNFTFDSEKKNTTVTITPETRRTLKVWAASRDVSMGSLLELLAANRERVDDLIGGDIHVR